MTDQEKDIEFTKQVINSHLERNPECAVIASVKDGNVMINVTPFGEIGKFLFTARLIQKRMDEVFEQALINMQAEKNIK